VLPDLFLDTHARSLAHSLAVCESMRFSKGPAI
jgi:hypothetical protein